MSHLLSLSFDAPASPSITLTPADPLGAEAERKGWGFAWYPDQDLAAVVVKDPNPVGETPMTRLLRDWDRFQGCSFVCHIRGAAQRATQMDTHPFARSYARRDFVLVHTGDLDPRGLDALDEGRAPLFEPVGRTDSERLFCWLLGNLWELGARSLAEAGWPVVLEWLRSANALGTANIILSDGLDVVAYRDTNAFAGLWTMRRRPPNDRTALVGEYLHLELDNPMDANRTALLVASEPLGAQADWHELPAGGMLVARRGSVEWASDDALWAALGDTSPKGAKRRRARQTAELAPVQQSRTLRVHHETVYTYETPVERCTEHLRLRPLHSRHQGLLEFDLQILVDGEEVQDDCREFEDVFGNTSHQIEIETPFTELRVVARSLLELRARERRLQSLQRRVPIPLVWMPWQREMMAPFLLPPELPETQLRELSAFAMAAVVRQGNDLVETLRDLNQMIFSDFAYIQGATHLQTTPFEVYTSRRGVCQDFANLFICLARLLNVPARYRVGYIHTGADYANTAQSEASHAWVEVYLPSMGWHGFDPTNGCLAGIDHVRVASGRNYGDATPTSGTIYRGGTGEVLEVTVRVEAE
jgi:transglutaminase-like putative cysteine protease/predicted glutamine amidotransferase